MKPNEYQQLALRTEPNEDHYASIAMPIRTLRLLHGVVGASTETGELNDQLKRHVFYGTPLDDVNVMEECGDILWYVAVTLDAVGFTMEDAMTRNIEKLRKRFPDRFGAGQAKVRDLDAERAALEDE